MEIKLINSCAAKQCAFIVTNEQQNNAEFESVRCVS